VTHCWALLSSVVSDRPKKSIRSDADKNANLCFLLTKKPVVATIVESPNKKNGSMFFAISMVPKYEPSEEARPIVASGDQYIFGGFIVGIFICTLSPILWVAGT
jgi:hypothetical protein